MPDERVEVAQRETIGEMLERARAGLKRVPPAQIYMCDAGYQSSVVAGTLRRLGFDEGDRSDRGLSSLAGGGPADRDLRGVSGPGEA